MLKENSIKNISMNLLKGIVDDINNMFKDIFTLKPLSSDKRIWELDFLRGIALILMTYFHLIFSMNEFFGYNVLYSKGFNYFTGRASVVLFILISGISSSLSRNNFKRGIKLLFISLIISLVSYIYNPGFAIKFGIIHFFAASLIIYPLLRKLNVPFTFLLGTAIIGLDYFTSKLTVSSEYLFPLGFTSSGFTSSDYYPLIPWFGLFLYGAVLGKLFYKNKRSLLGSKYMDNAINRVGRHTLFFYLIHQPIIVFVLWIISII